MSEADLALEIREKIQKVLESHDTVLYMKGQPALPQCGFSAQVVQILRHFDVPFHAVNVLADQDVREGIKAYNNWPTIPQLFHKGKFVGGCDIVTEMAQSGELGAVLGVAD